MPYASKAQERYFHTHQKELEKQGVKVSEWDESSKGLRLPERLGKTHTVKSKDKLKRGMSGKTK